MNIVVNTRALFHGDIEGADYFVEDVFSRLAKQHPEHQFYFLIDKVLPEKDNILPNVTLISVAPRKGAPFFWNYWYNQTLPSLLKKLKANLFVSADGISSLRTKIPQCLLISELGFLHYPGFVKKSHQKYYKRNTEKFLSKAEVVITVSEYMKNEICNRFDVDDAKVHVVYSGINEKFQPVEFEQREQVKGEFADGCEYFFYAGYIHPRKNLINLLRAFSVFKKKQKSNMKLVLYTKMAGENKEFIKLLNTFKYRNDVKLISYVSETECSKLTAGAYAVVYPSFFESFGLPPLEALQCGVPVIVSSAGAMPEIGGNAYLYVNPDSFEDIAAKMMLLYKDETLRNKLIENGKEKVSFFSGERAAQKMWDCIELAARPE